MKRYDLERVKGKEASSEMFQSARREAGRADLSEVYRLAYVSEASALFGPGDLREIGERSIARNAELDITGILVMDGGRILQILEGDQKVVIDLFCKISSDPRHENVQQIAGSVQEWRYLSCWSLVSGWESSAPAGLRGDFKSLCDRRRASEIQGDITPDEVDLLKVMALFCSLPL